VEDGDLARPSFFGFVGGVSAEPNTVEISKEAGQVLGWTEDDLVHVSIEYSYEKLESIELEPITVDDFEVIEQHCNQIEEQLLN
jgi:peroxin-1